MSLTIRMTAMSATGKDVPSGVYLLYETLKPSGHEKKELKSQIQKRRKKEKQKKLFF